MTIKEALNMPEDMPVLDLAVTVKAVMERKTGTHEKHGEWSFQDLHIEDETGDMWVKCQNKEDLSNYKGHKVQLTCFKSDKFGWVGLKTFDDEYQGQVRRKLKMTSTGVIKTIGGQKPDSTAPAAPGLPTAKDASICRQTAGKVIAELWHGTGKTFSDLVTEAAQWENYFLSGLPPAEEPPPACITEEDPF